MSAVRIVVPLVDLSSVIRIAKAASVGMSVNAQRIERAERALEAVSELVDAQHEVDAAGEAMTEVARSEGEPYPHWATRYEEADKRWDSARDRLSAAMKPFRRQS